MAEPLKFNRIVLGLPHHRPSRGMQFAAEMARLLQLDLFGLFVQEEYLFGVASLPFAREFKFLGGGWCPLDAAQLSRDMEIAAKSAERAFADAAKTLRTTCQFEVVRGSMAEAIASVSRANDIVLLTEPNSAEFVTPQFFALLEAAMHSAAAVLLVPGRIVRHSGAIVAIATAPNDSSIDAARTIADAAKEELVVIEAFQSAGKGDMSAILPSTGPRVRRISLAESGSADLSAIESALRPVGERLVVMTRGHDYSPLAIASMRHVPVLIIEPSKGPVENDETSRLAGG